MREYMNIVEDEVNEAVGPSELYHATSFTNAKSILQDGYIYGSAEDNGYVCVTRNKALRFKDQSVQFVIDANKAKHRFAVKPFDFFASMENSRRDSEERIYTDKLPLSMVSAIMLLPIVGVPSLIRQVMHRAGDEIAALASARGIGVIDGREPLQVVESFVDGSEWPQVIDGNTLSRKIEGDQLHHTPQDFDEGDLVHNITSFGRYELRRIPVEGLKLGIYAIDDQLVGDYESLDASTQPPIVYNPIHNLIIDGNHRANAAAKRGDQDILAYVGDPATYSPPDDEDDDGEWHPSEEY